MCNKHIWEEKDVGNSCPVLGCQGKRYDEVGAPYQEVIHFPLKPRLEALLRCDAYEFDLGYESYRGKPEAGFVAGTCVALYAAVPQLYALNKPERDRDDGGQWGSTVLLHVLYRLGT